jgi:PAS domain S-box-containing protein
MDSLAVPTYLGKAEQCHPDFALVGPDAGVFAMNRAGTGEGWFTDLRSVPNAARYALELAIVAASYLGLAEACQMLPSINLTATPLWPPTGFALALVLLRGYRIWPAVLLGSFFAAEIAARSLLASGLIGVGTLLAALAGAWLIEHWSNGRNTLESPVGVAKFALVAFVPTAMLSSIIAIGGLIFANDASDVDYVTWATWWLADATGILIIAPVIVLWATTPLRPFSNWSLLETAAILILATAIGLVAFGPFAGSPVEALQPYRSLFGFFILLPLMWAGLCGSQRNAAMVAFIFCGIAAWGLSIDSSTLSKTDPNGPLLLLFALSTSASLSALTLSAAIATRRNTEARLLLAQDQLNRQLAQASLALESSRRHYQILMEGVVDYAIFLLDPAGRVASWNSAAKQIIGYTTDEIVGKHFGIFYRPDERRAGEPNRALELATQRGKHEVEGWRIRKNGTPFFITGSVSSILDNDGNLIGFANIIRDATERRDAQEKLVQAREQLAMAQKMEAIGKLTGGIAHDFNNLLMIIGGNAQTFKRLLDPKLPRAIEAIQTAAKRGESLTRQLLTFARRQHLSPTVVDLNACISDMRTMIESSLRGNIVYKEVNDPGVWPVKVDLAELELAIVNIAVNARDAMPNGGTFSIAMGNVTTEDDADLLNNEFVAIQFSDTGTGIPPDLLTKIFDPFFTTKEVGKGTGLGLSQVYGFAHQAGGLVKADSKIGQGTTLTIYLPALPAGEIASEDLSTLDIQPSQRPAVLIVDDSAEVAEVTSSLFEHLGYDTLYRESADAALKLLADGARIDLVFSDIVMPGTIDGVGLASEIRSHYPHLPVVLTTGYSEAARAAPADLPILRKPFDSDALRGFIQDAMEVS